MIHGLYSSSPTPASSLLVRSPEATARIFSKISCPSSSRLTPSRTFPGVDVHIGFLVGVEGRVGGDLDSRRGLEAERGAAAGGEDDDVAAAGDLPGHRDRIVAGGVHVDEAALGDALAVPDDLVQRGVPALAIAPSDFS